MNIFHTQASTCLDALTERVARDRAARIDALVHKAMPPFGRRIYHTQYWWLPRIRLLRILCWWYGIFLVHHPRIVLVMRGW